MTDTAILPDLDRYLARIGWQGERAASLAALSGLLRAHMEAVPFENLDVLLGRPIRLDLEGLQAKLVDARRGGYCFEHCTFLEAVLRRLGYVVRRHAARVTLMSPWTEMPRTHMFLTVELPEGTFIVDPGFGTQAPPFPVPMIATPNEHAAARGLTHWMARDARHWILRARGEGGGVDCWVTTMEEENPVDFAMANHYTSTHPASSFVSRIMLRALTPQGRVTVMNRDVKIWRGDRVEVQRLGHRAELRALLGRYFGFDLPEVEAMRVGSIPEWD